MYHSQKKLVFLQIISGYANLYFQLNKQKLLFMKEEFLLYKK